MDIESEEVTLGMGNLPLLSNSIIVYFPPKRPISVYAMVNLVAVTASGASGSFVRAGQLCPSAGLTGSVSDSHCAISENSGIIMMGRRCRKMRRLAI